MLQKRRRNSTHSEATNLHHTQEKNPNQMRMTALSIIDYNLTFKYLPLLLILIINGLKRRANEANSRWP
jgi:hypothetical protein